MAKQGDYRQLEVQFGDELYEDIPGETPALAQRAAFIEILTKTNYRFTTLPEELVGKSSRFILSVVTMLILCVHFFNFEFHCPSFESGNLVPKMCT